MHGNLEITFLKVKFDNKLKTGDSSEEVSNARERVSEC